MLQYNLAIFTAQDDDQWWGTCGHRRRFVGFPFSNIAGKTNETIFMKLSEWAEHYKRST